MSFNSLLEAVPVNRPLILVSNDDGHFSRGLAALRAALRAIGEVIVCAPETEQSAVSHALSLNKPLRIRDVSDGVFAVDGTPADCVYVALHAEGRILPRRPDLVVSGINHGLNLGQDVFYSGTVAAAREGALRGIPAIAASAHVQADFEAAAIKVAELAQRVLVNRAAGARAPLVNVNFPRHWTGDFTATRTGARIYDEVLDFRKDPRGRDYVWLGGSGVRHDPDPGSDTDAYDRGLVSVTALILDLSAADQLAALATLLAPQMM